MKSKRKKIAFYGLFGQQNLGNEATLQAVIYNTHKYFPDAELTCICSGPDDVKARHHIPACPISKRYRKNADYKPWLQSNNLVLRLLRIILIRMPMELQHWVEAFKILNGTHMLIVPGTGFLTDAYSNAFGWPYDILKWSLVAKISHCKLIYLSVGAGPIYRPLSRLFIRSALALADFRSYRDNSTRTYLRSIKFPAEYDWSYPDLAFNLPEDVIPHGDDHTRQRPVVGIGLMCYAGKLSTENPNNIIYQSYLEKLVIFVKWLLSHEYDVRLLIGDVLYDQSVKQDFRDLLKERGSEFEEERIIDEPVFSVEQLLFQIMNTDLVVATRFHNVLLALMLNKPVISISFHHKCVSLMSEMGLSEYCQDIHNVDADWLINKLCDLEQNSEKLKPLIKLKAEEYRRSLDEQYRAIFTDL